MGQPPCLDTNVDLAPAPGAGRTRHPPDRRTATPALDDPAGAPP
ncbi:hypothetical protein SCATT_50330 [Streptantibioticus cattleyicolor NRRL 8057 = DSM 46488]|uniref:Uncharacterized protein n=1 Tax=Streptantibioticus cattleyicolor (strain ATCC 35852 / DSM 46488 / JCM 4925 / NBRC 14057 / NRRL 8057) TaxID=1003195 RepID=G8X3N2_STREN|nr:hypothetical protein SCATT_50330 [Streptantibioticus cattleyicolor NRRL 8057 = DSM 46488]